METLLQDTEIRVLGCLVEKQLTTPEYYPLTLNSLLTACNQKSNRDPVVTYDDRTVADALEGLCEQNLIWQSHLAGARVPKYEHGFTKAFSLSPAQLAVLCVLMLRGPQTPGEIRGRTTRLYEFSSLEEVEETLDSLINREPEPLVIRLPRQPGRKEARCMHLLSGAPELPAIEEATPTPEAAILRVRQDRDRLSAMEEEISQLRQELEAVRTDLRQLRSELE